MNSWEVLGCIPVHTEYGVYFSYDIYFFKYRNIGVF